MSYYIISSRSFYNQNELVDLLVRMCYSIIFLNILRKKIEFTN